MDQVVAGGLAHIPSTSHELARGMSTQNSSNIDLGILSSHSSPHYSLPPISINPNQSLNNIPPFVSCATIINGGCMDHLQQNPRSFDIHPQSKRCGALSRSISATGSVESCNFETDSNILMCNRIF